LEKSEQRPRQRNAWRTVIFEPRNNPVAQEEKSNRTPLSARPFAHKPQWACLGFPTLWLGRGLAARNKCRR
jgi:hypothetical protein